MKNSTLRRYVILAGALLGFIILDFFAVPILSLINHGSEAGLLLTFFSISLLCALSFIIFHVSYGTHLPSFVVAIFFGIAAKPLLTPVIDEKHVLSAVVGFGATLILFSGGLETPFSNFRKLFWKIISLSFIGLLFTAWAFSHTVFQIGNGLGAPVSIAVAVLLGAILASTDPAAIIPVLKQLRFSNRSTKDIIVSESALTDVTGTLLTVTFLGIVGAGSAFTSINGGYQMLFSAEAGYGLLRQMLFGTVLGVFGYGLLTLPTKLKERHQEEYEADAAFFLFSPGIFFTMAVALGGSGYLAAFVAGLLFVLTHHLHETEKFFNHTIEGFLKPIIFVLLGALLDIRELFSFAGVGILAALAFMFVLRPIAVFLSLAPALIAGRERLSIREILFISFVRETGAIPAVLLVTVVSLGLPGMEGLVPIGMWVILATLIIEPPLTPLVAKLLKVAAPITDEADIAINAGTKPFVVLASRGRSYIERLPRVVDWASKHLIGRVVILHCLEDKYTPQAAAEIGKEAAKEFQRINDARRDAGKTYIDFEYVSRTGFLQDNIEQLSKTHENVTAIFVGRKLLDYRLNQVKELAVPLFFID